jgi:uncharacterized protein YdcH (DUF465 family)
MSNRLFRLMERHQNLDERLRLLQRLRKSDPCEIVRIKKAKLALKDRIASFLRGKQPARS